MGLLSTEVIEQIFTLLQALGEQTEQEIKTDELYYFSSSEAGLRQELGADNWSGRWLRTARLRWRKGARDAHVVSGSLRGGRGMWAVHRCTCHSRSQSQLPVWTPYHAAWQPPVLYSFLLFFLPSASSQSPKWSQQETGSVQPGVLSVSPDWVLPKFVTNFGNHRFENCSVFF